MHAEYSTQVSNGLGCCRQHTHRKLSATLIPRLSKSSSSSFASIPSERCLDSTSPSAFLTCWYSREIAFAGAVCEESAVFAEWAARDALTRSSHTMRDAHIITCCDETCSSGCEQHSARAASCTTFGGILQGSVSCNMPYCHTADCFSRNTEPISAEP